MAGLYCSSAVFCLCAVTAGREQAALTGEKLRQSNISYVELIHSTLDRAVETADIIHQYLPNTRLRGDEILIEGGPIPPQPTIPYWQLPPQVRLTAAHGAYLAVLGSETTASGQDRSQTDRGFRRAALVLVLVLVLYFWSCFQHCCVHRCKKTLRLK